MTDPAALYLSRLAPGSRRSQGAALRQLANFIFTMAPENPVVGTDSLGCKSLAAVQHCIYPVRGNACCTLHAPEWWKLTPAALAVIREALMKKGYAPATTRRHLAALRGVLKECWRLRLLDSDALARLADVPPVPGRRPPSGRALSAAELATLREAAGPRDRALLAVMVGAGLRRAEAASLCPGNITDENEGAPGRPLTAQASHPYQDPAIPLATLVRLTVLGKGSKVRTVYLAGQAAADLRAYLDTLRPPPRPAPSLRPSLNDPLFGLSSGDAVWKALRRLGKRTHISFTPHDLRRSFISRSLDAGVDLVTVQAAAGHADPRTTSRYDRRGDEAQRAAARRVA